MAFGKTFGSKLRSILPYLNFYVKFWCVVIYEMRWMMLPSYTNISPHITLWLYGLTYLFHIKNQLISIMVSFILFFLNLRNYFYFFLLRRFFMLPCIFRFFAHFFQLFDICMYFINNCVLLSVLLLWYDLGVVFFIKIKKKKRFNESNNEEVGFMIGRDHNSSIAWCQHSIPMAYCKLLSLI